MPSFGPPLRELRRRLGWSPTPGEAFERWLLRRLVLPLAPSASWFEGVVQRAIARRS